MLSILDVALPTLDLKRRILLRYIDGSAYLSRKKMRKLFLRLISTSNSQVCDTELVQSNLDYAVLK